MKNTPPQPQHKPVNLLDIILMFVLALALGISFISGLPHITITIMLLLGVWSVDVYLKRLIGVGISTSFADLSFASLVFTGSRGVSLISEKSLTLSEQNSLINIFMVSFILGVIWLPNLSLSALIEKPRNEREKSIVQYISIAMSFISFLIVVLSQLWGFI